MSAILHSLLDTEFEKFRLSDPYTIGTYDDVEKDEYWMFLEAKETPNEIGSLVGISSPVSGHPSIILELLS
jgi:hypothetical protein